jgi:hypothetical protein
MVLGQKAKNPRLTGNRGFLKIVCRLEFQSHDAQNTGAALPVVMQPMTGACFSIFVANVVFISYRR